MRFEHLTDGAATATGDDLRAMTPGLGAALVELPLRDAGCLLPSWEELVGLSDAARELACRCTSTAPACGSRSRSTTSRSPRSPGSSTASTSRSTRGSAGLAGAAVVGDEDVVDELRAWRQRMGGTLFGMTPYAVSALVGLRDRLPRMGEYVAWARELAAELVAAGLRVNPDPPHMNTFEVFADAPLPDVKERLATSWSGRRCSRAAPGSRPRCRGSR